MDVWRAVLKNNIAELSVSTAYECRFYHTHFFDSFKIAEDDAGLSANKEPTDWSIRPTARMEK
jgi:hypothetical protein